MNTAARTIARIIGAVSVGNRSVLMIGKGLSQKKGRSPLEVVPPRRKVPQSPLSAEFAVALGTSMFAFLIVPVLGRFEEEPELSRICCISGLSIPCSMDGYSR